MDGIIDNFLKEIQYFPKESKQTNEIYLIIFFSTGKKLEIKNSLKLSNIF